MFPTRTTWFWPPHGGTAVCSSPSTSKRGSSRSSNMRLTVRGIIPSSKPNLPGTQLPPLNGNSTIFVATYTLVGSPAITLLVSFGHWRGPFIAYIMVLRHENLAAVRFHHEMNGENQEGSVPAV